MPVSIPRPIEQLCDRMSEKEEHDHSRNSSKAIPFAKKVCPIAIHMSKMLSDMRDM